MLSFFNDIMNVKIGPVPVVFIIGGMIVLFFYLYKKKGDKNTFKRLDTKKEIGKYLKEYMNLNNDQQSFWLKSGPTNLGYVIESARMTWPKRNKDLKDKIKATTDIAKIKQAIKEDEEKDLPKEFEKAYIFKVASTNPIKRQLQKVLNKMRIDFMLKYMIVEDKIITFSDFNATINAWSNSSYHFGVWVYSNQGMDQVDDIAIKLKHQLLIDEIVNTIPKQTYLEMNQSKEMEQLNAIAKIKNKRQDKMLEDISKGEV